MCTSTRLIDYSNASATIEHENDDRLALKKIFFFKTTFILSDWLCWYLGGSLIFDWLWLREVVV